MIKKLVLLFLLIPLLPACYNAPDALKPAPWIKSMMPKDAPNNFKRGWIDGCETGLASMTNSFYKTFYTFKQDPKLREDATYYKAWKSTYNFCRHYIYGNLRQSNQRMNLPGKLNEFQDTFMGAEGIFVVGPLQLWGPGDWLVPLQKVGNIGGDRWMSSLGGGDAWSQSIGGSNDNLDYRGEAFNMIGSDTGLTMDYSSVPFFAPTDPQ